MNFLEIRMYEITYFLIKFLLSITLQNYNRRVSRHTPYLNQILLFQISIFKLVSYLSHGPIHQVTVWQMKNWPSTIFLYNKKTIPLKLPFNMVQPLGVPLLSVTFSHHHLALTPTSSTAKYSSGYYKTSGWSMVRRKSPRRKWPPSPPQLPTYKYPGHNGKLGPPNYFFLGNKCRRRMAPETYTAGFMGPSAKKDWLLRGDQEIVLDGKR